MNPNPLITIDGPSGVGKSTLGLALASHLGWMFMDSGVFYRLTAWIAMQDDVHIDDHDALEKLAHRIVFTQSNAASVIYKGQDVSLALRDEAVGQLASQIAIVPRIRQALLKPQRRYYDQTKGLIAIGRDMAQVVFPEAALKLYLDASEEQRIQRRHEQLKHHSQSARIANVREGIRKRDQRDASRQVAPLSIDPAHIVLDTTGLSAVQVFDRSLEYWINLTNSG